MTIVEFIRDQYPIKDRIKMLTDDPYKRIEEEDDLPFDKIGIDPSSGRVCKLVEIDDERVISVSDLISLTSEEVAASGDLALQTCYNAYMDNVDIQDMKIADIMNGLRTYKATVAEKGGLLDNVLRV